jgi:hypothetical protein
VGTPIRGRTQRFRASQTPSISSIQSKLFIDDPSFSIKSIHRKDAKNAKNNILFYIGKKPPM